MNFIRSIKDTFREGSKFKFLLLSVLITGLSYGLYKGMLDNFLAEVVAMGEMDRGITEFFRELPGIALVFILAVFYMLSAETLYKAGAIIMLVGMGMHAVLPPAPTADHCRHRFQTGSRCLPLFQDHNAGSYLPDRPFFLR